MSVSFVRLLTIEGNHELPIMTKSPQDTRLSAEKLQFTQSRCLWHTQIGQFPAKFAKAESDRFASGRSLVGALARIVSIPFAHPSRLVPVRLLEPFGAVVFRSWGVEGFDRFDDVLLLIRRELDRRR